MKSEVIRARAAEARPDRCGGVQHLRGDRRGGAPGAPGDPQGAPRAARRADHRHRLRRADRSRDFAAMPEVDLVLGNRGEARGRELCVPARRCERGAGQRHHVGAAKRPRHFVDGFDGRARAFLQVQNGCDHRCTFCIIPFGRGNSRSRAAGRGGRRRRAVWSRPGFTEMVLTGRRHHRLGRRSAGRADASASWCAAS